MPGKLLKNLLVVGITLGTAWAVRGQFGHEQGAAWAGSVAALAILMLAGREDWYPRLFKATLAAAFGWGLGGMMSYGIVVGYGQGVEFVNVYYGLVMLFVIGGLYGFMGGGLFGLALSNSEEDPVDWLGLLTRMAAGAVIMYFFLIEQWGIKMTPPRSELWAACLGMALALTWYLWRNGYQSALRVAVYAGLGAGFGFASGNFLQVLGKQSDIAFNFWNVMEYSLGFWGGIGMAYGTFTSEWKPVSSSKEWGGHFLAYLGLAAFIPLIILKESFSTERLSRIYGELNMEFLADRIPLMVGIIMLIVATGGGFLFFKNRKNSFKPFTQNDLGIFFRGYFLYYILLSLTITGAIVSAYRIEQYLYLVNYVVVLLLLRKISPVMDMQQTSYRRWGRILLLILGMLAILAVIAINTHEAFEGMQRRFEI